MAITAEALERLGIHQRPDEVERLVLEAMEDMLSGLRALDPLRDLTRGEKDALRRGGLSLTEKDYGIDDPLLRSATEYGALVGSSFTVAQVASMLGVDSSRIRQRLAGRTLYGIRLRSGWRIPRFQFDGSQLLPGVDVVVQSLPEGTHPLGVMRWFTLPNADLVVGGDEQPVSPRDWLRMGGDPGIVADLAADLAVGL